MFNIDESFIRAGCLLSRTYDRGMTYYRRGRVKSLKFNRKKIVIEGRVEGTRGYSVYAAFDKSGDVIETGCSCPAARKYWGYCKHRVALLLTIMEHDKRGSFDAILSKKHLDIQRGASILFDYFESAYQMDSRNPISLDITYEVNIDNRGSNPIAGFLSLKIGENRLYVVRNIQKLLETLEAGKPLVFGKNFTYNPMIHEFNPVDEKLIRFLLEIHEVHGAIEDASYYSTKGIFEGRKLMLTNSLTIRFLEIMEERTFRLIVGSKTLEEVEIVKEDLPISFDLVRDEKDLVLETDFREELIPITKDSKYILVGDKIYKPSRKQLLGYIPLKYTLMEIDEKKIRFSQEERDRFVSEILPYIENIGSVTIKPELESIILKEELHTELYLRPQGRGIGCDVKFIYGERQINPFGGGRDSYGQDEKILIRDNRGEQEILSILHEYGFSVQPGGAYLENEEAVFDFLYSGIPRIQEIAHIYYSEDFKGYLSRRSLSYSGGIRLNSGMDMLEFSFEVEGIDPHELGDIFAALREKKRYYRLKDGTFLSLEGQELDEIANLMDHLDIEYRDFREDTVIIPKYRAMFLDEQINNSHIKDFSRSSAFKELVSSIKEPGDLDLSPPESLKNILRGYQVFGFRWLKSLSSYGLGGILADDMGLGKTLQVIALLLSDKEEKGSQPSLAVVPTSLVYNWEDEVKKFAPCLKTLVLTGSKEERLEKIKDIDHVDLVITSYPLIRRDGDELEDYFFRYCILDEAQHIKNPDSQSAKTVKTINAGVRLALTGTPMENALSELWSIFDFIMPGYLFSYSRFKKRFEVPIVKDGDEEAARQLSYHIKPFILRRLKKDVLRELPEKIEHKVSAELTTEQKKVYLAYMHRIREDIEKEIEDKGFNKSHIKILAGLTRLRQICCHPSTFLENYKGGSGKMELLEDIIDEAIQGGHRILLFSQFTGMLDIIKKFLEAKQIEYLYLDGSTPTKERGRLVRSFNEGLGDIFLISLKAGGTGLNLTGADTVIHFDPWWNPAVEDQATDRAYRIGQEKVVHVMKLITRGTIEEKIFALQQKKKELIDRVIKPGQSLLSKMTEEEIRELFNPEAGHKP